MILEVYKIVCGKDYFLYTGYRIAENKFYEYYINKDIDNSKELFSHISQKGIVHIGFNNIDFDYILLHEFIDKMQCIDMSSRIIIFSINTLQQNIIEGNVFPISEKERYITQLDVFRIAHLRHKGVSLRDLLFSMNEKYFDYPKQDNFESIRKYNSICVYNIYKFWNCIIGKTDNILYKNKNQIAIRVAFGKKYRINCMNYPYSRIGEEIILKLYARSVHKTIKEIKEQNNDAISLIALKNVIPDFAKFNTKEFNKVLDNFKNKIIIGDEKFEFNIKAKGLSLTYGLGGMHGISKPGIYTSDNKFIIIDQDIHGLYPHMAVYLDVYPKNTSHEFLDIYKSEIIEPRDIELSKDNKDYALIDCLKGAGNSIYGKSKDINSWIYDPVYSLKIAIGSQMFTTLWIEMLSDFVIEFISVNTDGICFKIRKSDILKLKQVNERINTTFGFNIDSVFYEKIILKDVNNYIAINKNIVKTKGYFEFDKPYDKDPSGRIIPIALYEYFVNNTPIETTIKNHKNIFDFCYKVKVKNNCDLFFVTHDISGEKRIKIPDISRYYYSDSSYSGKIQKISKNSHTSIDGYCMLFNEYSDRDIIEYHIDYKYYIQKADEIKNIIIPLQMDLFGN